MLRQRLQWKLVRLQRQIEESLDNLKNLWRGSQVTTRMCPSCRALVDSNEKYCPHCQERLGYRTSGIGKLLQNIVPNFSIVSYAVLTLNFLFFIILFLAQRENTGQDIKTFLMGGNAKSIVQWGGDVALLVYHGQWWRLISAIFIHIGIIHLAFNSYALIFIGPLLEEAMGRERFLVLYIATGVFGFIVSNAYYPPIQVTAGASGAIFGMIGAGIILSRRWASWGSMLKDQLVHWAIYGLVYGFLIGANNAAHVGGFVSGMGFAYLLRNPAIVKSSEETLWTILFWAVSLLTMTCLGLACFSGLQM